MRTLRSGGVWEFGLLGMQPRDGLKEPGIWNLAAGARGIHMRGPGALLPMPPGTRIQWTGTWGPMVRDCGQCLECRPSSKNGRVWNPKLRKMHWLGKGPGIQDPGTQWQSPGSWHCLVRTLRLRVLDS